MSITKLKISKEQLERLDKFFAFSKAFNAITALNSDKQLFVISPDGKKLEVYTEGSTMDGGSGVIDIKLDVEADFGQAGQVYWVLSAKSFVDHGLSLGGDTITVEINHDKHNELTFKGAYKGKIVARPFENREENEVLELQEFIDNAIKTKTNTVKVDLNEEKFAVLEIASGILKRLGRQTDACWSGDKILTADDLCILSIPFGATTKDPIYINRHLVSLLKDADSFELYGPDQRSVLFEIPKYGIRAQAQLEELVYQYPSTEEMAEIMPGSGALHLDIETKDLYEAFDKFKVVFAAGASVDWKYGEVKVKIGKDVATKSSDTEIDFYFDNLKNECYCTVPVHVTGASNEVAKEINFLLPTCLFTDSLEKTVKAQKTISWVLDDEAPGIKVKAGDAEWFLPKMSE